MRYGQTLDGQPATLSLKRANRHGLIAGATGTGKTVTLQTFAERFSREGVPVFCVDVKGDLEGVASHNNTVFWDVFGEYGHGIKTTIESMGAPLMARMLDLTPVQSGVVTIAFAYAKDQGIELDTIDTFRSLLGRMIDERAELSKQYGNVTTGSVGSILRSLLTFEAQGGASFFGNPKVDIYDFLNVDDQGRGQLNLLNAVKLVNSPKLYSTFLLWLLTEFYNRMPEVGDPEKPKFVFFFDEAHLLFSEGSKVMIDLVERTVRLIRSKGVGVYFVTQGPSDVPEAVLAQLSNRVQHALRAFTAKAISGIKAAAVAMPKNPDINAFEELQRLTVGKALATTLQRNGSPTMTQIVQIDLPESQLGPLSPELRKSIEDASPFKEKYAEQAVQIKEVAHDNLAGSMWSAVWPYMVIAGMFSPVIIAVYIFFYSLSL